MGTFECCTTIPSSQKKCPFWLLKNKYPYSQPAALESSIPFLEGELPSQRMRVTPASLQLSIANNVFEGEVP